MAQVFISYRRKTSAILAQFLRQELKLYNIDAFVDVRDIESSGPFPDKLASAIQGATTLICLLAEGTLDSEWVQEEIRQAYDLGKTLIPVFQESYQVPATSQPQYVAALLRNQGVRLLDLQGIFVKEAVQQLATLIKPTKSESSFFSEPITAQLQSLNKTFEELTQDQFRVINTMRYQKRLLIAGCAGSGKTLIAAEKAIRLDNSGLRTLVLCHSAFLTKYIQGLVAGTGVDVIDFTAWIRRILIIKDNASERWTHYEEPTADELANAFDRLVDSRERYDAIIVDEGQDFRSDWWIIIESALVNQETGVLYIFYDDNQTLLPERAQYPINQPPVTLSKNCRNAGEIFELVKKFHPQSPETSIPLKKQGIVRQWSFTTGTEQASVRAAVEVALSRVSSEQLIVLTTEPEPVSQSSLEGLTVILRPLWKWQEAVQRFMSELELSDEPYPTAADIEVVREMARKTTPPDVSESQLKTVRWMDSNDQIVLSHPFGSHFKRARLFFQSADWAAGIPRPKTVKITFHTDGDPSEIQLFTVSSYKGLEADGVVLFVPALQVDQLESNIYVGLSRARFLLHLVIDITMLRRIRQIQS